MRPGGAVSSLRKQEGSGAHREALLVETGLGLLSGRRALRSLSATGRCRFGAARTVGKCGHPLLARCPVACREPRSFL